MMKLVFVSLVVFTLFLNEIRALDAEKYIAYIEELSQDEKFVEEYSKWSLELFSQPDYLYGKHEQFPCDINTDSNIPTSVHALRPSDIKCIGAIGDSLTAGLGAHAITPIGLLFENRGVSWSVGGDHTFTKILSIPNALRQYNTKLAGYSTKVSVMVLNGQDAKNNRLNVAKSGDRSYHMPYQAELLMNRTISDKICDWKNDWKMITFFVGGNDLCTFCEDVNETKHTPEEYLVYVRDTLDKLYTAPLPRTLVNLVLVLDVRSVKDLNSGGYVCELLHKRTCPCAAFPTPEQAKILDDYVPRYQQILIDLVNSGRYDGRDDFTVVVQPFLAKTKLPLKENKKIDFSYFAPDCFHFSGKGHAQAALSLWNNMLEPVGAKQWFWHMGETFKCPTKEYPFVFTNKNSAKALEEYKRSTNAVSTTRESSFDTSTTKSHVDTTEHHKYKKHNKSHSSFSNMKMVALASCFFLIMIVLIIGITKRQKIRVVIHGAGRRHLNGFNNSHDLIDNDEFEIWNRSKLTPNSSTNNNIPKTHGARIDFE